MGESTVKLKEQFKKVPVYQPGKSIEEVKEELGLNEVIKLASNENPYGPSTKVRERILKEIDTLALYPDGAGKNLKNKIAAFYDIDFNQIILGNGSDEIIQFISRAYLNSDRNVITADLTFPIYKANAMMEGAEITEIPLLNGKHDLRAMASAVNDKTALIWICNPNNPTGTIIGENELVTFLDRVREDILVVIDEAYAEYVTDRNYPDTIKLMNKYPNLMVLRTFSKIYGLAALRIGYGIAKQNIINDLLKVKEPFNANSLAQASAEIAITDQGYVNYCLEQNQKSKEYFINQLKTIGLDYYPSETNFVLVKHNRDDEMVFNSFLEKGIIIRPGNKLGAVGTSRITLGTLEQMHKVTEVLKQINSWS